MNLQVDPKRPETFTFSEVPVKGWLKYVANASDFWWGPQCEHNPANKGDVRWAHPLNAWAAVWIKSKQIRYA